MIRKTLLFVVVSMVAAACDKVDRVVSGLPTPPPETITPVKRLSPIEIKIDADLQKQIEVIAQDAKGTVGAAVVLLETGDSATINANQRFAMQSVYKLPIAMAVLQQVDAEKIALDELIGVTKEDMARPGQRSPVRDKNPSGTTMTVRDLIQFSISESDGTASDVLLRLAGGPTEVQAYLNAIGVNDVVVANTGREFTSDWQIQYQNWITPGAAITLLRCLHEGNGISALNREILLESMTQTLTGPNRLNGQLPKGTTVAHKTGTSGSRDRIHAATNDVGIITLPNGNHMLIAVFVGNSTADEKTRESIIARIAKVAWDKFSIKN